MYEQIFDDFNTIKQHYERNGKKEFEESAVFELLEHLYPSHGSVQAVQTIIDMLDAQRIRDSKNTVDNSNALESNSDESSTDIGNDHDIIEVEVPKKEHPFIDLTENSTESDEAVIIAEKTENKSSVENIDINSDSNIENNDSEASCHDIHSLSDSDVSKHYNEDSYLTGDDVVRSNTETQLLNYLAILDQPNPMNQLVAEHSNNDSLDVSEMLEENNNDPNNNFNEENVDANRADNDASNRLITSSHNLETNSNKVLNKFYNEYFNPVPLPGCSKEITTNFEVNDSNKPTSNYNSFNPAPGCSKDLDIPQNIQSFKTDNDDDVERDITCIQEIVPWATSDKIRFYLIKYSSRQDRKELTLLKLMKEEPTGMTIPLKRKLDNSTSEIESKIAKTDPSFDMEDSLDLTPNLHLDSIFFNESSDDSQSSRPSNHMESTFKVNQSLPSSNNPEFSKTSLKSKWLDRLDNNTNKPVFLNSSSNMPTASRIIKKERNETVVSGLLQEQEHLELMNGKSQNEKSTSAPARNFLRQPVNEPFFPNNPDFQLPPIKDLFSHQASDGTIEKILKEEADNNLGDIPAMNGFANNTNSIPSPNKDRNVLQPPKLLLPATNTVNIPQTIPVVTAGPRRLNYVRPAILSIEPGNRKNVAPELKEKAKEDLNGHERMNTNHPARQDNITPIAIRHIHRQVQMIPSRIQFAPPATIVRENQAERHLHNVIRNTAVLENEAERGLANVKSIKEKHLHRKKHNVIRIRHEKLETVTEPPTQNQPKQVINPVALPGTSGLNSGATSTSAPAATLDQSIYNKLRSIFPDVKSSYIKKICMNPPNVVNTNDKAYILNALIEHLLSEGSNHLRPVEYVIDQPSLASVSIDDKYDYLLGIFPEADPTYVRDFVVKNPTQQEVDDFIQQKMDSRDYPTKDQYMARIKITEQIKQYTTELNIENFLELFPDPFKHFEDETRKCAYQPIAMEFLKSVFIRNKVHTISYQYKNNRYNLSLTARVLTGIGADMKSKRVSVEMPTEDIPLLQEMAFIKNKQKIINHLNMLKEKEEQLFKDLKEQNLLLTCQCCYNDECMPTKSSECNEGHVFCHECIIRGTESALADAEAHVRCFTDCTSEFPLATLQKVLPPTKFSALLQKRQTAEVIAAGMDGLVSCPFCHFASIPPPEDKVFKCLNPECMKETCKLCKELNHVPLKCDEVIKTDKARHILEEKMTEALVRTCYQCKKQFYKEDGCNKMKCTCGALMCYLCSKPIKGYDHFNAQGGANTNLCPLWSDDRLLNAKAVIKVAEDVKKVLLQNNPNLKIDTDSLLPKIPAKTRGPHDDIPNANQLPEHIMRIANAARR